MSTPTTTRTVDFYLLHEPTDPAPDYRWQCRVTMSWVKDGDGYSRQENGHGATADEAYALARAIAAAFMYEDTVPADGWPANKIDLVPATL